MAIEIGDYVVFEYLMEDRYAIRKIVDETYKSYKVLDPRWPEEGEKTMRKSSFRLYRVCGSYEAAKVVADQINTAFEEMGKRHRAERAHIQKAAGLKG